MTIAASNTPTATPTTIAVSTSTITQTKHAAVPTPTPTPTSAVLAVSTSTTPVVASVSVGSLAKTPTPTTTNKTNADEVIADATCVEFLHLMKAFSESAVNVTEMAQRVDSLVHQDEQLLRLLPLATPRNKLHDNVNMDDASGRGSMAGSVEDTTDDESSSSAGRARVDTESDLALALKLDDEDLDLDVDVDMDLDLDEDDDDEEDDDEEEEDDDDDAFNSEDLDMLDDEDFLDESDGASTDADTRSISQRMGSVDGDDDEQDQDQDQDSDTHAERERRAQEDLQRWMELELDLDSTEDPYDASLHLPGAVESTLQTSTTTTTATAATPTKPVLFGNVHAASISTTAGSHANSSSVLSTTAALAASSTSAHRFRSLAVSSAFDKKSVTAALFEDDDEDDDSNEDDLVLLNAMMRKKDAASKPTLVGQKRRLEDQETKSEEDHQAGSMWGMEVDSYEQDLLSSIDHAVLCDRENRFLQWDLEIEAATAAAVAAAAVSQKTELRTPPASSSTAPTTASFLDVRQKMLKTSSPRDTKTATHQPLRSPSNVDTNLSAEDWGSLDFGTFQNRTVSHILSSCLHKRKLHHPYKDRVTLVNFNVPGGEPIGPLPNHSATPSLAGSLLFGAGFEAAEALGKHGHGTAVLGLLSSNGVVAGKDSKLTKSGEKKPKKPRADGERKKSSHKSDPFADFDAFGDDVEARKLAMTKLENLPLPDLTNLPNDLKELKRKIEATEHKVEGTKHRHRKGGPCPRCQVQNQLRAAKRAYHKRAVAHKKLPQLGAVSPALTATAVVVNAPPAAPVATTAPVAQPASVTVSATVTPSIPASMASAVATITAALDANKPPAMKAPVTVPVAAAAAAVAPTVASAPAPAPASVVRPATVPVVKDTPPTVAAPAPSAPAPATSVATTSMPTATAAVTMATASTPFPRRSCGENALASPFTSPSSVPSSSSSPSSPEASPPPVHHVTVTSA